MVSAKTQPHFGEGSILLGTMFSYLKTCERLSGTSDRFTLAEGNFMSHKRLASFNRLAMRVVAPVLVFVAFSAPLPYSRSRAIVQTASVSAHTVTFAYWSEQDGLSSSVLLNNATIRPLTIRPALYSLDGQPLAVPPVVIQPLSHEVASISEWLAQAGAAPAFTQGSLSLILRVSRRNFQRGIGEREGV